MAFFMTHNYIDSMFVCHKQSRQTNYTVLQNTLDKENTIEILLVYLTGGLPLAYFQDFSGGLSFLGAAP